ncbi:hypothetical protein F8M41_006577 [Gigaspora margarita]|uniref:Uncharacterized protein n=1 Tax=Gigaspora margarita TaxID=4874 RepID=A0A8H3X684_GIGMA|nr:hypothetical protein F8M41_006577 [Gigaspora margarita]
MIVLKKKKEKRPLHSVNIQSQGSIDDNTMDEHQAISEEKDYNDAVITVIKYQAILEEEDKNNIVQVILKRENEANDVDEHYAILEENKTDNSDNETLDNEANNIQLYKKFKIHLILLEKDDYLSIVI